MRLENLAIFLTSVSIFCVSVVELRGADRVMASPSDMNGAHTHMDVVPQGAVEGSSRGYSIASGAVEQGFSPYPPSGPSDVSPLLRYMMCDPHSCPQVWAGYEAQRIAEMNAWCSKQGHCGRRGCGCGSHHQGSGCASCCSSVIKNRYRQSACETGAGRCDSCDASASENLISSVSVAAPITSRTPKLASKWASKWAVPAAERTSDSTTRN